MSEQTITDKQLIEKEQNRILDLLMKMTPSEFLNKTTRVSNKWDEPDLKAVLMFNLDIN